MCPLWRGSPSLPFIFPTQQTPLLTYALTHNTVNTASYIESNASSGLSANADDTYKIDNRKEPSRSQDLYASEEQRRRDQYEIDEDNWHEVAFEEVNGASTCRLALHSDWIINQGYAVDGIVEMNLPEQGISGPFKITAIKHILPQKRPVDEDPDDEREYKPVTGLFTHRSDQVHTLAFASADGTQVKTLGVTAAHPIFSTTHYDWRLAGELQAGEKVLTYYGEATVLSNERKPGNEYVYNLEVKDLHNFLVGDIGVVVHNDCVVGGKRVCPPPKSKNLVSGSSITNWISTFNKRTLIKGDPNAGWYQYQKRIAGDTEIEIPVPGSARKMWADGFDADANALVETKHTASNSTFDIDKYLQYENNPSSVQPWEKGIFETLNDEMDKYSKIVNSSSNRIAELHIKISGNQAEARALFSYLGGKYDFPVKVIHVP